MLKKQNGITLVALVITIIVLLILAGVSLSMVFNQNGLITKAQEAANATKNADAEFNAMEKNAVDYITNMTK